MTPFGITLDVVTLCIGGPLVGLIIGGLFYIWMRKSLKEGVLMVTLTFINAFLLFFLCEFLPWNVSGILALVLSSILISYKGKLLTIEDNMAEVLDKVWKFSQFISESILFVLTGIFIGFEGQKIYELRTG